MVIQQYQVAGNVLADSSAVFNPVPVVCVGNAGEFAHAWAMNVTANDAIDLAGPGVPGRGLFEAPYIFLRTLQPQLDACREGHEVAAEPCPQLVLYHVGRNEPGVRAGGKALQVCAMPDARIEYVTVKHEKSFTVGGFMNLVFEYFDTEYRLTHETAKLNIVISRNVDDSGRTLGNLDQATNSAAMRRGNCGRARMRFRSMMSPTR